VVRFYARFTDCPQRDLAHPRSIAAHGDAEGVANYLAVRVREGASEEDIVAAIRDAGWTVARGSECGYPALGWVAFLPGLSAAGVGDTPEEAAEDAGQGEYAGCRDDSRPMYIFEGRYAGQGEDGEDLFIPLRLVGPA
jgi:hypothetical protein